MAHWQISIKGKGLRKAAVENLAAKLKETFDGASIHVKDATPPKSRADRFSAAMSLVEDAKSEIESLKDELQEWFDNLPESFQSGDKGSALESSISELDEVINELESASGHDVEFPGMYS